MSHVSHVRHGVPGCSAASLRVLLCVSLCAFLCVGLALISGDAAQAQAKFPAKAVTIVVPYPPGGSNDIFARAVGRRLSESWGQAVVIDNRPGAGGSMGAAQVARAVPDGHTLMLVSSSFATNAAVQAKLPFDPVEGFIPVAMVGTGPFIVAVANKLPVQSVAELLAFARANPGKLNYASSGPGSINQFATELFKIAAGVQLTHVPYKGMGPAVNDLIGGHVDVLIASVPSVMQQLRGGKARGLAVTSAAPSAMAPGLPALAQAGVPGYSFELWWGILAPAGVPRETVNVLNTEINRILATAEMKAFLANEGAEPARLTPEEFAGRLRAEILEWKRIAREAGIQAE